MRKYQARLREAGEHVLSNLEHGGCWSILIFYSGLKKERTRDTERRKEAKIDLSKPTAQKGGSFANVAAATPLTEVSRGSLNTAKDLSKSLWKTAPDMMQSQPLAAA